MGTAKVPKDYQVKIRSELLRRGWTQGKLVERIREVAHKEGGFGFKGAMLNRIITGDYPPNEMHRRLISKALGIPQRVLFDNTNGGSRR